MSGSSKRYRWTSFFIEMTRSTFRNLDLPAAVFEREKQQQIEVLATEYGSRYVEAKFHRWLEVEPPILCAPPSYHPLLLEVESSYIHGDFYPALTAACTLGERILNELLLDLRDDYRSSARFKDVAGKEWLQNWRTAVSVLSDWKVIDDPTAMRFTELLGIRNPTVHGGELSGRAVQSKRAIDLLYAVTAKLFGDKHPRFFRAPGEWYVRSGFEHDPLTAKFVIPHCARVGYRHEVVSSEGRAEIRDLGSYPEEAITDEEFARRRQEWQESRSKAP